MRITTKYKIGQTLHYIHNNKPDFNNVESIEIYVDFRGVNIEYVIDRAKGISFREDSRIYATKEELIKSL